jgi:hypothetical protein
MKPDKIGVDIKQNLQKQVYLNNRSASLHKIS